MIKIGIIIDVLPNAGGGMHMILAICNTLKNIKIKNYQFIFITTYLETKNCLKKETNTNSILFNKDTFLNKIYFYLFKRKIIKFFLNILKIKNPLDSYLTNNNIKLVYFLSPSHLILFCNKVNFISTIWELEYKKLYKLPEYNKKTIGLRNDILENSAKRGVQIFVGTQKLKNQIIKTFPSSKKKITIINYPPYLTTLNTRKKITKFKHIKNYLFYPAQYWSHKNHDFIIKSFLRIKNNSNKKIKFVFTGHDKGYLKKLKQKVKINNVEKNFIFFKYLNNTEIINLYKRCKAVIMPTKIGTQSLPLYEAFFFKKPIIYNHKILDSSLKKRVIKININNYDNFDSILNSLKKKNVYGMIKDNYNYYKSSFDKKNLKNNLIKNFSQII
jgi:hypothetical protein